MKKVKKNIYIYRTPYFFGHSMSCGAGFNRVSGSGTGSMKVKMAPQKRKY
jgi:hypothetical protein